MNSKELKAAPPKVWILTLALALLFFVVSYFVYESRASRWRVKNDMDTERPNVSAIDSLEKDVDIYVLGTSLTREALPKRSSIHLDNQMLTYRSIGISAGRPHQFFELIDTLVNQRNTTIFLEANMFVSFIYKVKTPHSEFFDFFWNHRRRTYLLAETIFNSPQRLLEFWLGNNPANNRPLVGLKSDEKMWEQYKRRAQKFRVYSHAEMQKWFAISEKAQQNSVRLILLDLPRSQKARKHLPPNFEKDYQSNLAYVKNQWGIATQHYPQKLDFPKSFKDPAHMNEHGQKLFTAWFEKELTKILSKRDNEELIK